MTNTSPKTFQLQSPPMRPIYRAWFVQETEDGKSIWTELSGLWPTNSGKGYRGSLKQPQMLDRGRIVILPATSKPKVQASAETVSR
jgi:hypothetical protein